MSEWIEAIEDGYYCDSEPDPPEVVEARNARNAARSAIWCAVDALAAASEGNISLVQPPPPPPIGAVVAAIDAAAEMLPVEEIQSTIDGIVHRLTRGETARGSRAGVAALEAKKIEKVAAVHARDFANGIRVADDRTRLIYSQCTHFTIVSRTSGMVLGVRRGNPAKRVSRAVYDLRGRPVQLPPGEYALREDDYMNGHIRFTVLGLREPYANGRDWFARWWSGND